MVYELEHTYSPIRLLVSVYFLFAFAVELLILYSWYDFYRNVCINLFVYMSISEVTNEY
jgi:hypothetical protein